jgi:TM2 domain-containing membrane protein YozV
MVVISTSKKILAVILSIVIWGLGHMYIGRIKRGIVILLSGIAIMFLASVLTSSLVSLLVALGYLIWLIYDLSKIIRKINLQSTE